MGQAHEFLVTFHLHAKHEKDRKQMMGVDFNFQFKFVKDNITLPVDYKDGIIYTYVKKHCTVCV